jgi:hypothetical protein
LIREIHRQLVFGVRGEHAIRRDVLALKYGLSDRQARAVGYAIEHGRLTIQDYEDLCPEVNRRTLQRDLRALVAKELLLEQGQAPTDPARHYRPGLALRASDNEL